MSTLPFPSPTIAIDDEREVLLGLLDFLREVDIVRELADGSSGEDQV